MLSPYVNVKLPPGGKPRKERPRSNRTRIKVDTLSKNDSWESLCSVCGIGYTDPLILTIYIVYNRATGAESRHVQEGYVRLTGIIAERNHHAVNGESFGAERPFSVRC